MNLRIVDETPELKEKVLAYIEGRDIVKLIELTNRLELLGEGQAVCYCASGAQIVWEAFKKWKDELD